MDEKDIWRAAQGVIQQQGDGALAYANKRIQQFTQQGEPEAAAVWKRIRSAIGELQDTAPGRVH